MRKKANKLLALLTAVAITVTGVNVPANNASAASVKLSAKKVTLTAGKKKTIYLKKGKKKLAIKSVKSSKKKVATVKKSGKKIVITAKKKGTATITVKAKVNKKVKSFKCKVTVKSKATPTAAPTAAPSATASSAPASQAPASAVPSDAASAVPSDAASAAPSDDASAAPSADVSAEPSAEPSKEPSKVTEIKILNNVALTNEDGTEAYVYYDVLDQYAESMRTSVDIQWTTSPASKKVDKVAGKITIKPDKDSFTYGQQIFLNGVHIKTGIVQQATVTVGMAQAVDSIKFGGFVDTNDPTKIIENLPKNFAVDRYYLLFTTYDQNGCPLDVTESAEYASKNLTFICDNPLLLALEDTTEYKTFTVSGTSYAGVKVQPKDYVNKGGEANITAIANKTGNKTTINVVVGAMAQLKSLELLTPSGVVADGDQGVEIPYKALDTDGNTVTNYETIVRSSNELSLSASDNSELVVREKNDGTAGIYWYDSSAYDVTDYTAEGTYSKSAVSDGIDRQIALTTVVVGGESNNTMLSVSDIRIPSAIVGIKDDALKDYMANKGSVSVGITSGQRFIFKDQYGKEMALDPNSGKNAQADAFFVYAGSHFFGNSSDGGYYGVRVVGNDEFNVGKNPTILKASTRKPESWETGDSNNLVIDGTSQTITAEISYDSNKKPTVNETTVQFAIAKISSLKKKNESGTEVDVVDKDWNVNSKVFSKTIYGVPIAGLTNLRITGLSDTAYYSNNGSALDNTEKDKGDPLAVSNLKNNGGGHYNVYGTYKGNDVEVKPDCGWILEGADSDFEIEDAYVQYQSYLATGNLDTSEVTYGGLFDYGTYGNPAKKANFVASLYITKETATVTGSALASLITTAKAATGSAFTVAEKAVTDAGVEKLSADVTICTAEPTITGISAVDGTLRPTDTSTKGAALAAADVGNYDGWVTHSDTTGDGPAVYCGNTWAHSGVPMVSTVDQYGRGLTGTVLYTISDIKEAENEFTHISGNATVEKNGTEDAFVKGAEVGDTFKVTAKVKGTTISTTFNVTVGADTSAKISSAKANNTDKDFRTGCLGFVK